MNNGDNTEQHKVDPTALCQIEIPVSDLPRALQFYESVLGWQANPAEIHEYALLSVPDHSQFGISLKQVSEFRSRGEHVLIYFRCRTLERILDRAVASGGSAVGWPRVVPGIGTAAVLADPDGNRIGLFVPKS